MHQYLDSFLLKCVNNKYIYLAMRHVCHDINPHISFKCPSVGTLRHWVNYEIICIKIHGILQKLFGWVNNFTAFLKRHSHPSLKYKPIHYQASAPLHMKLLDGRGKDDSPSLKSAATSHGNLVLCERHLLFISVPLPSSIVLCPLHISSSVINAVWSWNLELEWPSGFRWLGKYLCSLGPPLAL